MTDSSEASHSRGLPGPLGKAIRAFDRLGLETPRAVPARLSLLFLALSLPIGFGVTHLASFAAAQDQPGGLAGLAAGFVGLFDNPVETGLAPGTLAHKFWIGMFICVPSWAAVNELTRLARYTGLARRA